MRPGFEETADLVTFTEEMLNGKLDFLCSGTNTHTKICDIYIYIYIYINYDDNELANKLANALINHKLTI